MTRRFATKWLSELLRILDANWFLFRMKQKGRSSYATLAAPACRSGFLMRNEDRNNSQKPPTELRSLFSRRQISFNAAELEAGDPLLQLCGRQGSGLCSPVHFGTKPNCVLSVGFSNIERKFSAGQQNIAQTFATFLAIQLRNVQAQRETVRAKLVNRDLQIASSIQRSLLPHRLPCEQGLEMAGATGRARARSKATSMTPSPSKARHAR